MDLLFASFKTKRDPQFHRTPSDSRLTDGSQSQPITSLYKSRISRHNLEVKQGTIGTSNNRCGIGPSSDVDEDPSMKTRRKAGKSSALSTPSTRAYVLLISALCALSSLGPALELQEGVGPMLKTFWRTTATAICLLPLAAPSLTKQELSKLSWEEWAVYFPICSACYSVMTAAFIESLELTTLVNSVILGNMTSLIIIASKAVMGLPVLFLEGSGAGLGIVGAVICATVEDDDNSLANETTIFRRLDGDHDEKDLGTADTKTIMQAGRNPKDEMLGNFLALLSSFGIAAYLMIAKRLRAKMNVSVFMCLLYIFVSCYLLLYLILISKETVTFDFDPHTGVLGWINLSVDRLPLELYLAIVCNIVGTVGYVRVLEYFDPVVVSMVMLTEPVVAAILGVASGVENLPGLQTWVGDAIVVAGSIMVIYSGVKKAESEGKKDKLNYNTNEKEDKNSAPSRRHRNGVLQRWRSQGATSMSCEDVSLVLHSNSDHDETPSTPVLARKRMAVV